jgi:hypothetical protein
MRVKVSWQKYTVATLFFFVSLGLTGCAPTPKKYQDTSELEKPPELGVVSSTTEQAATESSSDKTAQQANKGLGDVVKRTDDSHLLMILSFGEAWKQVEKAINLSGMEISDKNIQKGQYYVVFDPDLADNKNSDNIFTSFFISGKYNKARYLLTFTDTSEGTSMKAEFLEYAESRDSHQDGYADPPPADNGLAKFLQTLYTTLHDDLPLAQ